MFEKNNGWWRCYIVFSTRICPAGWRNTGILANSMLQHQRFWQRCLCWHNIHDRFDQHQCMVSCFAMERKHKFLSKKTFWRRTLKFLTLLPWKKSLLVSSGSWNRWTPWTMASKSSSQKPPQNKQTMDLASKLFAGLPLQAISVSTLARCQDGNVLAGDVALFAGEDGNWSCGRAHLHNAMAKLLWLQWPSSSCWKFIPTMHAGNLWAMHPWCWCLCKMFSLLSHMQGISKRSQLWSHGGGSKKHAPSNSLRSLWRLSAAFQGFYVYTAFEGFLQPLKPFCTLSRLQEHVVLQQSFHGIAFNVNTF